jgi:archaellum component FlaC
MVTVETIEMEINFIKGEIEEIKKGQDKILETLNKLDDRYPTRREFNAVKWVVSILG